MDDDFRLPTFPPEILLHIFTYLDLPELACLATLSPVLAAVAADPALQRNRLLIVAPSRVAHALFGQLPPRPTVPELVHRGVMRGIGIERRWRAGSYFYSVLSVKHYETLVSLQRMRTSSVLGAHLRRRAPLSDLHDSRVLPDVEGSSLRVSRSLLPVVHKLKWSIQRDRLAQAVRDDHSRGGLLQWLEGRGRGLVTEGERVRLAVCPDVRKVVRFFEDLSVRR